MVEENKKEEKTGTGTKAERKKEEKTEEPKKKSKIGLFVGAGLLVFLLFLAFFSLSLGIFDKERLKEEMGLVEDTISYVEKGSEEDWGGTYLEEEERFLEPDEDSLAKAQEDSIKDWMTEQKKDIQEKRTILEVQRRELELLKIEVDNLLKQKKTLESERIATLAKIYDGMKAQEVAAMMNNLNDETVVAILLRMKTRNAAKVLGLLNPERAARISHKLMVLK